MIEEILMLKDFGPLGIMVIILLVLYLKQQKREDVMTDRLVEVIKNNTVALTRFYEQLKEKMR